jgi:cell division protein FtsI (penicillin-binding protein 3)
MTDVYQQNKLTITGAQAQALDQARLRLIWVVMVLMMGYLAIGLRMGDLTLLHHKSAETADSNDTTPIAKPLRGEILDRNGNLMASSLKMASVYADTTMIDNPEQLAKKLAAILPEQTYAELLAKLSSGKEFIWIQRDVTPKQEYAINAIGNPALSFQDEGRRIYPDAGLTAHILGYTDVDGNGIAGIEKYFNKQLTEGDKPVQLTIDLRVQHIMHRELAEAVQKFHAKDGVGMVMDVNTGEIIAMVSLPDFDPNHVGDASDWEKFNRATLGVFEMGSTFKLFSMAAALDSGKVHFSSIFDASEPIKVGRFKISDYHAKKRPLTVPEIFIYSSNIGTAKMADSLGPDGLKDFYKSIGFMEQAPVELPERGTPIYPTPWSEVSTLTASFGHGIAVSPLHLIRAASALVNGGIMPVSTLVKPDKRDNLSLTPEGARVVSAETSQKIRQLLELVVADGTGTKAYVDGYDVGGKTGTAEKNIHGRYEHNASLSSFIGVFPIQTPRYAVLAILDEPQGTKDTWGFSTGGWTAAPVVARVIEQMGPLYQIPPDLTRGRQDIEKEMSAYLKDLKEGSTLASLGTDH